MVEYIKDAVVDPGLDPLVILAAYDYYAGIDYFLNHDCDYYDANNGGGYWKVLFYGTPTAKLF